jgi:glycosyltransferase involved in cell wall biosynthesis
MTRICAKKANHIVTVSENSKSDIIEYLSISPQKITVIYNFILESEDVCKQGDGDSCIIAKNGDILMINKPFFVSVSTLQPGKNIEGLITAFSAFSEKNPQYYLYIVGNKGWGYDSIFKVARKLNICDKVFFTGYVDDSNLAKLYSNCEGVVYVSFYEGFGIPPLEGFYHNKACVVSDTSSLPEVVGQAGILVNPYNTTSIKDGLESFIQNKCHLERHIPTQISKFNSDIQVLKFKNVLHFAAN